MKSDIEKEAFALYPDYEALQDNDHEHYAMINKGRIKLREAYIKGATRKFELCEKQTLIDLEFIRNYFGENDRTPFEHMAFDVLDGIIKTNK